jgi:hypothetical protein
MRVTTTDPMTLNDVTNLEDAPFLIEGSGPDAMKIYFESASSRDGYLAFQGEDTSADPELIDKYNAIADNEIMGGIN